MAWTWVRPSDMSVLERRPLLDVGTGDGQWLRTLDGTGLVVGIDGSAEALRAASRRSSGRLIRAAAHALPVRDAAAGTVLAGDLLHHVADEDLVLLCREFRRALRRDGMLVAWWYAEAARPAPDAPRFPRTTEPVSAALREAGFADVRMLDLQVVDGAAVTVGVTARD